MKETHVVSVMNLPRETVAEVRDEKENRPLSHQIRRPRLTVREKNPQKNQAIEMKALQTTGAKFRADTETVIIRHAVFGILPYVKTASLRLDAHLATNAIFDMLRQMRSPARSQRKVVRKDQVTLLRESVQMGCVSQDTHAVKFSNGTWHQIKIRAGSSTLWNPSPKSSCEGEEHRAWSWSNPFDWIPYRGVQGEPIQKILRST